MTPPPLQSNPRSARLRLRAAILGVLAILGALALLVLLALGGDLVESKSLAEPSPARHIYLVCVTAIVWGGSIALRCRWHAGAVALHTVGGFFWFMNVVGSVHHITGYIMGELGVLLAPLFWLSFLVFKFSRRVHIIILATALCLSIALGIAATAQ